MELVKQITDMVQGFQKTQVLYTAVSLGIMEELQASSDPLPAVTIANRIRTNVDATERLLNACVSLNVLDKEVNSKGIAKYSNSKAATMFLIKSSPMSMRPMIASIGDLYDLWGKLKTGVREGQSQVAQTFGKGKNLFDVWSKEDVSITKQLEFLQSMHMFSKADAPKLVRAFDLSRYRKVCDLGGGTGAIASELVRTYPEMEVTVLELPHVVNCAHHFLDEKDKKKVTFKEGDFFECDLPPADLYILGHVIHDWEEEKINKLLGKVYASLKDGGGLLVLEKLLNDKKDGPLQTVFFDLGMLLGASGRERSEAEYRKLLRKNEFQDIEVSRVPHAVWYDVILAKRL